MLEIIFSDSESGSLKMAQHCGPSSWDDGPVGFILSKSDGSEPTPEEKEAAMARLRAQWERENSRAKPVGGNAMDVLCPSVNLDIGPLCGPNAEQARFDLLTAMLGGDFPLDEQDPNDHSQRDMLWERLNRDCARLLERAKQGEPVRVWFSRTPYSLCGLYDTMWRLRDIDCPVTVIELPRYSVLEEGAVTSCLGWGEVLPGDWAAYLPLERELPKPVRRVMALEWDDLRRENAPLRAVVNGRLKSVGEDFYDPFIRAHIPAGTFRVAQLIGDVLGREQLGIGDWWVAKRIQKMLEQGELVPEQKGNCFYRDEVRRG